MKISGIKILSLLAFMFAMPQIIFSQTCRVKTGIGNNGGNYVEVYEYDFVDEKPEFPGGSGKMVNYINSTRRYPAEAYELGIEGRVTCSFVVYPDGKIDNIQVLKGVESSLNTEAMRVVAHMPDWKPGRIQERAVPVRVICCIPFRK